MANAIWKRATATISKKWGLQIARTVDGFIDICGKLAPIFHCIMRVLGPILVLVTLSLISFVVWSFFTIAVPVMDFQFFFLPDAVARPGVIGSGVFILINIVYNYLRSVFGDPGVPPLHSEVVELAEEAGFSSDDEDSRKPRKCKKCNRLKPPRAHHCSVCRKCVLKMDHHCPWIGNCVGFKNYRNFCLFLLFLCFGTCYIVLVYALTVPGMVFVPAKPGSRKIVFDLIPSMLLCASAFVAVLLLGGLHLWLNLTNQTTIEFHMNNAKKGEAKKRGVKFVNPYDLGWRRNVAEVFGSSQRGLWLFPYLSLPPRGDGLEFHKIMPRNV